MKIKLLFKAHKMLLLMEFLNVKMNTQQLFKASMIELRKQNKIKLKPLNRTNRERRSVDKPEKKEQRIWLLNHSRIRLI